MRCVRFDDAREENGIELAGLREVLLADRPGEVPEVLARAERAARHGSWVGGYLAYEAAPGVDRALTVRDRTGPFARLPLAAFGVFGEARPVPALGGGGGYRMGPWTPSIDEARYTEDVRRIRRHIREGDTYQVNHTFRLRAPFHGDPHGLYADLCTAQRGSHCAFLDLGDHRVVSASPELFFTLEGDRLVTRPMKGTAPRGRWSEEDREAASRLLASEKDRAENLMIVDLLRNDLGRVSRFGTVRVERLFEVERYETVWQLTSTISSRIQPGTSLVDLFSALFPCGSVTGAPKVRTMEIIAERETSPRGVYTGAIGYLAPPGSGLPSARFNVAIRTLVLDVEEGLAEYGVGGGITYDSTPEGEYAEARTKALVLTARRPVFRLLETLRYDPERGYRWLEEHLDRLMGSAAYFGFALDRRRVRERLEEQVAGHRGQPLRVRLTAARDGALEVGSAPLAPDADPVRLALDPEPIDPADPFIYHKTTRREIYERRRRRWPDHDDVLLVNPRGEVTESTIANLVLLLDGEWVTPPLTSGCLPGVHRRVLLEEGTVREAVVRVGDLERADQLALVNSVRLWRPARLVSAPAPSRP